VTLALLSALAYGCVLTLVMLRGSTVRPLTVALGCVGGLFLALVLVKAADDLLSWALALVGVAYALALLTRGAGVDETAPLVGAGLLLCGELATWSLDERWHVRAERALVLGRAAAVAALVVAGLAAAAIVVALAAVPTGAGLAWTVAGALAAALVLGLAARLAR